MEPELSQEEICVIMGMEIICEILSECDNYKYDMQSHDTAVIMSELSPAGSSIVNIGLWGTYEIVSGT